MNLYDNYRNYLEKNLFLPVQKMSEKQLAKACVAIYTKDINDIAMAFNPRCARLHGTSGSTGCIRRHRNNISGTCIATSSAKWSPTVSAKKAELADRAEEESHTEEYVAFLAEIIKYFRG